MQLIQHLLANIAAIDPHKLLISIVAFIVLLGVMVVVHEFGHFIVAKLCRVRVEAFSVGFGPRLFGVQYGETDYKVCLLPLGGYVKMTGESPEQNLEAPGEPVAVVEDDPGALTAHPRWQRMLIGFAGPFANFVLAFVLMVVYFGVINEVPAIHPIVIEWVAESSSAAQAGFQPGDVITHFGSVDNPSWMQVHDLASESANQTLPVTVQRGTSTLALALPLPAEAGGKKTDLDHAGLTIQLTQSPIQVEAVTPNSPAEKAGLRDGDQILSVDGHRFHAVDPALLAYLKAGRGKPVSLLIRRNGQTIPPLVAYPAQQGADWRLGFLSSAEGADFPTHIEPMGFAKAVVESKDFCVDNSTLIVQVLGRLFTRQVSVSQLAGPVGIARMAGQAAEMKGWAPKFGLAASISLNLGIINLLPFPILDGGMILLLLIESTIRRDISMVIKERIFQVAFVILMAFAAFIIFNDITKLPIFSHLNP
jgi:regulator of sigma E protease